MAKSVNLNKYTKKIATLHICYGPIRWKLLLLIEILKELALNTNIMAKWDKNITLNANIKEIITLHTGFGQIG